MRRTWRTFRLVLAAIRDLLIPYLPRPIVRLLVKKGSYAFLIHPRDLSDVERKYPFLKSLAPGRLEWVIRHLWPVIGSRIKGLHSIYTREPLNGYVVICPLSAKQMHDDRKLAKKRILQTVRLAEKLGCRLIGLGALSASMSLGGEYLTDKVKIGVTTGHAYTVAVICDMVEQVAKRLDMDLRDRTVAVVGAAGYLGVPCVRILSKKKIGHLILVDRLTKIGRLEKLHKEISHSRPVTLSTNLMSLRLADIIVVVTNSLDILIKAEHLKAGAVVVDDSQPRNTAMDLLSLRSDVLILDVVARAPGVCANFHFDFPLSDDVFTCMGEVLILAAREWKDNYCVGEFDYGLVSQIRDWGKKLNFNVAALRSFNRLVSDESVEFMKSFYRDGSFKLKSVGEAGNRQKKVS